MKKHILRIVVTVLILSVIGGAVWFFFFKPSNNDAIYSDLVGFSTKINNRKTAISNLKAANTIKDVKDGSTEHYTLSEVEFNSEKVFKESLLVRQLIMNDTNSLIDGFNKFTITENKKTFELNSLFAPVSFTDTELKAIEKIIVYPQIGSENANLPYKLLIKGLTDVNYQELAINALNITNVEKNALKQELKNLSVYYFSLNNLLLEMDNAFNYYTMFAKNAEKASKKSQDEIQSAINKVSNNISSFNNAVKEINNYQQLISINEVKTDSGIISDSAKLYTITRMYGDLKNTFMEMFNNYADLILKVKDYDVKYVFNNNFTHDTRTVFYETLIYAVNYMAQIKSEVKTDGEVVSINPDWYNAYYDACVVLNTSKIYDYIEGMDNNLAVSILKQFFKKSVVETNSPNSDKEFETRLTSWVSTIKTQLTLNINQFVNSFNHVYKNEKNIITEKIFKTKNNVKTQIANGNENFLADYPQAYKQDIANIMNILNFQAITIEGTAVETVESIGKFVSLPNIVV